ncbi:MAG: hypothetical protein GWO24_30750 [Akkermansiaceae bacterium]|nr:hypothetical protein [Akkermansiaceae bacterium]
MHDGEHLPAQGPEPVRVLKALEEQVAVHSQPPAQFLRIVTGIIGNPQLGPLLLSGRLHFDAAQV